MDDMRSADVDFITIGQYLQPTRKHHAIARFVTPEEFEAYKTIAYAKGFSMSRLRRSPAPRIMRATISRGCGRRGPSGFNLTLSIQT